MAAVAANAVKTSLRQEVVSQERVGQVTRHREQQCRNQGRPCFQELGPCVAQFGWCRANFEHTQASNPARAYASAAMLSRMSRMSYTLVGMQDAS